MEQWYLFGWLDVVLARRSERLQNRAALRATQFDAKRHCGQAISIAVVTWTWIGMDGRIHGHGYAEWMDMDIWI